MGIKDWLGIAKKDQTIELPQVSATDVFNAIKELEDKINAIEDEERRNRFYWGVKDVIKFSKETALEVPSLCKTKEGVNIMYNRILSEINRIIKETDDAIAKGRTR